MYEESERNKRNKANGKSGDYEVNAGQHNEDKTERRYNIQRKQDMRRGKEQ